jgi:hypothetical protein
LHDLDLRRESPYLYEIYRRCVRTYHEVGWLPKFNDIDTELHAFSVRADLFSRSYTETFKQLIPPNSPAHWYLVTHAVFPYKPWVIKDQFIQAMVAALEPSKRQMKSARGEIVIPAECRAIAEFFDAEPMVWAKFNEVVMLVPIFSSSSYTMEPIYIDDLDFAYRDNQNAAIKAIAETEVLDLSKDDPW